MSTAVNNNFQDYDPRQRLTGAIVLILLAVILLPMLLSKKSETVDNGDKPVVMEITKDGDKVFISRISAISSPDRVVTGKADSDVSAESTQAAPPASGKATESKPETSGAGTTARQIAARREAIKKSTAAPKSAVVKPQQKTATTSVPAGNWLLQIGVYSQPENASKKVSELKKKGFDAQSGKVKTSKGTVTKVWLGPYKDKDTARRMQDRLQHKTRERGFVVQDKQQ